MPSVNRIVVAAAGAGKTTHIVRSSSEDEEIKCLIVTYTINNEEEIKRKFALEIGCVPKNVVVKTWFSFLLDDFVKPYQNAIYPTQRITGLAFVNGVSAQYVPATNVARHYFYKGTEIYSDKIAKFGVETNQVTGGLPINRLQKMYDRIYIDEVQDLAAWDIDIIYLLMRSTIDIVLVGDPRQATYRTNNGAKYAKYGGYKILTLLNELASANNCEMELMMYSHRCRQEICDFSDMFFAEVENTVSRNLEVTDHDGIFIVRTQDVPGYIKRYNPKILRYSKTEACQGYAASNFKASKGLGFDRTLLFPHGPLKTLLINGDFSALNEPAALYVAVTRARQSMAIVFDGECVVPGFQVYTPER